jgi:sec-independent protein translocase protein TatC
VVKEINFKEKIPLTHHLIELKNRLVQVTLVVAIFFGVCFYFIDFLLLWLEDPLPKQYADLTFITPTEPFFTAMKVSFMGSIFISMPWILYHVWGFIAPGLKVKEKKITALFVAFGTAFFLFGGLFCYLRPKIFTKLRHELVENAGHHRFLFFLCSKDDTGLCICVSNSTHHGFVNEIWSG